MPSTPILTESAQTGRIGARYEVHALLGRGGMATVYRVTDIVTQRTVALKQLSMADDPSRRSQMVALFEREFHALAQLSHPRVIEVYDYGIDERGPYYTMELLDGGDLRERSPLPWRDACALLSGVCSSLALIHSRHLVHRDVGPANIRCTRDGQAKLIDFGALAPMGSAAPIVGTAAFVPPEVIHRSALDGRTDLFSFGATLYFALTGRPPYPARNFAQLAELWSIPLPPPSGLVRDVPESLDALVMSLLSLEPAMRPRTAFEVMQRLTAIAGIESVEPLSVSRAYLSTPVMIARDEAMDILRDRTKSTFVGRGGSLLIEGASGVGRSRLLDACVVEAKLLGTTTLRAAAATARGEAFAVAQTLAEQLFELLPDVALAGARSSGAFEALFEESPGADGEPKLKLLTEDNVPRLQRETALSDCVLRVSETHPLAIAIDDAHAIDEASTAVLAVLSSQAEEHRLLLAVTAETGAPQTAPAALEVIASCSARIGLGPLTRLQTEELLGSLFGDAQNLGPVSEGIYRASAGNPRASMELARHLVDKGVISYESGGWTLPARLDASDLPGNVEDAMRERIAALQPSSRRLAEIQALANDTFSREDYGLIDRDADSNRIDRAIHELVSNQVLVGDGRLYSLSHRGWASALTSRLGQEDRGKYHRTLATFYEQKVPIAAVRHLLAAGLLESGLTRLSDLLKTVGDASRLSEGHQITGAELAATIETALDAARAVERPPRELHDLRRWLTSLSIRAEDAFYWRAAPIWLEQLKRDSGLLAWHSLDDPAPGARLRRALSIAAQQYAATPERERVYAPDEAVKALCHYVVISIAIGSRSMNWELLESLPGLLEPFAPAFPIVDVIRQNAIAACEARCRSHVEQARSRWIEVYTRLGKVTGAELAYIDVLRNAIVFAIGSVEARMGIESAATWAERLQGDALQQVNALYLRKIIALQMGDSEAADRYRREAEVLALRARVRQMFTTTLPTELAAHALAGDLTGVKQVMARIAPLAEAYPGWRAYAELAQAQFQQLRGDLEAARMAFERCIATTSPDPTGELRPIVVWPSAIAGYMETLVSLGRYEEARACGEGALETCQRVGMDFVAYEISRALALTEAHLNQCARAASRLDVVIAQQRQMGITGVILGASYEARARIAILAGDETAFTEYAELTAKEYRYGRGSTLGARWERLMAEARRASKSALSRRASFESSAWTGRAPSATEAISESLRNASTADERAAIALRLLCEDRRATCGYLYLVDNGTGLTLVASSGSAAPPAGLSEYLREYFESETSDGGDATSALTGTQMASLAGAGPSFRDEAGTPHVPVLMTSIADGAMRHAGVAVFVEGARTPRQAGGAALVAALSAHLIELGDTHGVAV